MTNIYLFHESQHHNIVQLLKVRMPRMEKNETNHGSDCSDDDTSKGFLLLVPKFSVSFLNRAGVPSQVLPSQQR